MCAAVARRRALRTIEETKWRWITLTTIAGTALLAGLLNGLRAGVPRDYWLAQVWLGRVAVGAMLAFGILLTLYAIVDPVTSLGHGKRTTPKPLGSHEPAVSR